MGCTSSPSRLHTGECVRSGICCLFCASRHARYQDLFVWRCLQTFPFTISLPFSALTISTSAISLLLVFRTNRSYGRWWEARKVGQFHV